IRLMSRFQQLFHDAPAWISLLVDKELTDYTRLTNGCEVFARASTNASTRGFDRVKHVVLDEVAHFVSREDDRIYAAIRPNLIATGGSLDEVSTPNGQRGMFFRQRSDPTFRHLEIPWTCAPSLLDPQEIAKERQSLGPTMFAQEYECSFN